MGVGLLATYLVGWAADRYGSKPVMMSGLFLRALLPLLADLTPAGLAERGADDHQHRIRVMRGHGHGGNLGFVADLSNKKSNEGGTEHTESGGNGFSLVDFIRLEHP